MPSTRITRAHLNVILCSVHKFFHIEKWSARESRPDAHFYIVIYYSLGSFSQVGKEGRIFI